MAIYFFTFLILREKKSFLFLNSNIVIEMFLQSSVIPCFNSFKTIGCRFGKQIFQMLLNVKCQIQRTGKQFCPITLKFFIKFTSCFSNVLNPTRIYTSLKNPIHRLVFDEVHVIYFFLCSNILLYIYLIYFCYI